jgi:hypothetical protein
MWARAGVRSTALVVIRTTGGATSRSPHLLPVTKSGPICSSGVPVTRYYHCSTVSPLAKGQEGDTNDGAPSHHDNKAKKRRRRSKKKDKTKEHKKEQQLEAEMKEWGLLEGEHKYTPGSTIRNQKQGAYPHRQRQQDSKTSSIIPSLLFASHGQMLPPEIQSAMQADPTYFHGRQGVATRWTPPSSNKKDGSSSLVTVLQQIQRDQQQQELKSRRRDKPVDE